MEEFRIKKGLKIGSFELDLLQGAMKENLYRYILSTVDNYGVVTTLNSDLQPSDRSFEASYDGGVLRIHPGIAILPVDATEGNPERIAILHSKTVREYPAFSGDGLLVIRAKSRNTSTVEPQAVVDVPAAAEDAGTAQLIGRNADFLKLLGTPGSAPHIQLHNHPNADIVFSVVSVNNVPNEDLYEIEVSYESEQALVEQENVPIKLVGVFADSVTPPSDRGLVVYDDFEQVVRGRTEDNPTNEVVIADINSTNQSAIDLRAKREGDRFPNLFSVAGIAGRRFANLSEIVAERVVSVHEDPFSAARRETRTGGATAGGIVGIDSVVEPAESSDAIAIRARAVDSGVQQPTMYGVYSTVEAPNNPSATSIAIYGTVSPYPEEEFFNGEAWAGKFDGDVDVNGALVADTGDLGLLKIDGATINVENNDLVISNAGNILKVSSDRIITGIVDVGIDSQGNGRGGVSVRLGANMNANDDAEIGIDAETTPADVEDSSAIGFRSNVEGTGARGQSLYGIKAETKAGFAQGLSSIAVHGVAGGSGGVVIGVYGSDGQNDESPDSGHWGGYFDGNVRIKNGSLSTDNAIVNQLNVNNSTIAIEDGNLVINHSGSRLTIRDDGVASDRMTTRIFDVENESEASDEGSASIRVGGNKNENESTQIGIDAEATPADSDDSSVVGVRSIVEATGARGQSLYGIRAQTKAGFAQGLSSIAVHGVAEGSDGVVIGVYGSDGQSDEAPDDGHWGGYFEGNVRVTGELTYGPSGTTLGADYVFSPDYALPALGEVERFVTTNRHLKGIPSAEEMREKGVNLGHMQTTLLEKIEELTLYVIQQDKKIAELTAKVSG